MSSASSAAAADAAGGTPVGRPIAALSRVHVLGTGGTIAGAATGLSKGSYRSGTLAIDALLAAMPQVAGTVSLSFEQVASGGSQDMSETVWLRLARAAQAALDSDDVAGLVITHGTDTLEETAFFLSLVLPCDKTVVVTGATRAASAPGADGPANVSDAIALAADRSVRSRGVVVLFDGGVFDPRTLIRTHIRSTREFGSANGGATGLVGPNGACFFLPPAPGIGPRFSLPEALPPVAIVLAHVGASARQVTSALEAGAQGIVLAGTGNGNASAEMLAALSEAAARGVMVVRASRISGGGRVDRNIEIDDDAHGFVVSADLDAPKARILAQLLIAAGTTERSAVQAAFEPAWQGGARP